MKIGDKVKLKEKHTRLHTTYIGVVGEVVKLRRASEGFPDCLILWDDPEGKLRRNPNSWYADLLDMVVNPDGDDLELMPL